MLKSLTEKVLCPTCRKSDAAMTAHVFTEGADGHVRDGILLCEGCRAWCPIEDDLLELVAASLLDPEDLARFRSRFHPQLEALGLAGSANGTPGYSTEAVQEQLKQRHHFDWWADNDQQDYSAYQRTPFWVAADAVTFQRWLPHVKADDWLLDLGCADGRSSARFVGKCRVVGFDISKKMVRKAIERARQAGAMATTTFLVADANNFPFRDQSFDWTLTYGVLHHFPDPGRSCREIHRVLKPGGVHFGSENNRTVFRGLFDFLMRVKPLWVEEAGAEPLISHRMIHDWTRGLPVRVRYSTSVFLPPHLFNLVGRKVAPPLLAATDRVCSLIPGLAGQGGLIVFEIAKN